MATCPYCEKPVVLNAGGTDKQNEIRKETKGFIKKEVMYWCPHCDRVLGFGFFLGGLYTRRP